MAHEHKYIIADDQAVHVLLDKMLGGGTRQRRREKLLKALEEASRHYQNTSEKERQAFFHGLLTGYAVALKLLWICRRSRRLLFSFQGFYDQRFVSLSLSI